jgi:hypothetical protein
MNVRYIVALESSERQQLEALSAGGTCAVRRIKRAQILLAADAGRTDEQIANTVQVSTTTVYRTKRRFVEDGMEHAFSEDLWTRARNASGAKVAGCSGSTKPAPSSAGPTPERTSHRRQKPHESDGFIKPADLLTPTLSSAPQTPRRRGR